MNLFWANQDLPHNRSQNRRERIEHLFCCGSKVNKKSAKLVAFDIQDREKNAARIQI